MSAEWNRARLFEAPLLVKALDTPGDTLEWQRATQCEPLPRYSRLLCIIARLYDVQLGSQGLGLDAKLDK